MEPVTSPSGVVIVGAYPHRGQARSLVHRFKYGADLGAGTILADAMATRIGDATCLIPVPRATLRSLRYGVDAAAWLAHRIGRSCGLPVVRCLRPALWWPRHAGSARRRQPSFSLAAACPQGGFLIDDVATSGVTLDTAAAVCGATRALVATVAMGPLAPLTADRRVV